MDPRSSNLNLARKWRPKSFDQVVGQDIAVRMLKNGLFLKKFFPVYLFAGQRGCGKTSTARIFAAAINCQNLPAFQQDPTQPIPCMTCKSCVAMINGDHPDFIEIDAASHTGVDNVRQIIESSSYMPLVGQKKVYLIDEAHMLSKAAFNAFLKILEEPPMTVVFILATTEVPKLPQTVLSRCFQLIFNPINNQSLKKHLQDMCSSEQVVIDDAALDIILDETEGSARDAINLLERVRFSSDTVTEKTVLQVLGKVSTQELINLFTFLIEQKADALFTHLQTIGFAQRSPQLVWDMLIQLCRSLVWIKYGVQTLTPSMAKNFDDLKALAAHCSHNRLTAILNLLWSQEELFLKTNKKHLFLEMVLLQICQQVNVLDLEELIKACKTGAPSTKLFQQSAQPEQIVQANTPVIRNSPAQEYPPIPQAVTPLPISEKSSNPAWAGFIQKIPVVSDQLLISILMQAQFKEFNVQTNSITLQLSSDSSFFKNKIEETKPLWLPVITEFFPGFKSFSYVFSASSEAPIPPLRVAPVYAAQPSITRPAPQTAQTSARQFNNSTGSAYRRQPAQEIEYLTIKDPAQWPQASLLLRHFSGRIKKL